MKPLSPILLAALLVLHAAPGLAANEVPAMPIVSLTAASTASVANDRMYAWLRAESDNVDPARAAADVNARMAKALARAKAVTGIEVSTTGYSSYQFAEKGQPTRWRVAQTMNLEGSDFATLAALVTRLQADDGLAINGMSFGVSPDARRKAEDALTQQAIKQWQVRAQNAARGFGYEGWRTGRVTIQSGDFAPPRPMFRAAAAPMAASAPPVSVEGGNTDVTVTVNGEAILDPAKPLAR